ncbi:MAG: hypothetical protein NW208_02515 [Bryobacter sp.]|nr:hypothetical protein [Bryobacter sp.]
MNSPPRPSLAVPPPARTLNEPEQERRYNELANLVFARYAPATDDELRLTNDILLGAWLLRHWKSRSAAARRTYRAAKVANESDPAVAQLRETWRYVEDQATRQAMYLGRRKQAFADLRTAYEATLAHSGFTLADVRHTWLSQLSPNLPMPEAA